MSCGLSRIGSGKGESSYGVLKDFRSQVLLVAGRSSTERETVFAGAVCVVVVEDIVEDVSVWRG